ncbi:MAG TPA: hypothetical protein VLW50_20225 [Streptosporangiaceae bacterium]|nr:hypothetical protein [Streptosporangiaceae bacterium]
MPVLVEHVVREVSHAERDLTTCDDAPADSYQRPSADNCGRADA